MINYQIGEYPDNLKQPSNLIDTTASIAIVDKMGFTVAVLVQAKSQSSSGYFHAYYELSLTKRKTNILVHKVARKIIYQPINDPIRSGKPNFALDSQGPRHSYNPVVFMLPPF